MRCILSLMTAMALLPMSPAAMRADDYATARAHRLQILVGPSSYTKNSATTAEVTAITTTAQGYENTMESGSGITELWSDLPFPSSSPTTASSNMTATFGRLKSMALAYASYGSTLHADTTLLTAIQNGLAWMNANQYVPPASAGKTTGNWWDWRIGSPLAELDTLVMIFSSYPSSSNTIANYVSNIYAYTPEPPDGFTGANLMWVSEIRTLASILTSDSTGVTKGMASVPSLLTLVTSGDGFYADGSFIQHTFPGYAYNGAYGLSLIEDLVNFTTVYSGTQWALSASTVSTENSLLFSSFAPFLYKGALMDDVRGRTIARYSASDHVVGRALISTFLHAAGNANATDAAALNSAAKYWLQQDTTYSPDTNGLDVNTILLADAVTGNSSIAAMSEPTGFHLYPSMDRVVHLRPGWGASLSMWSSRHGDYEDINSENKKGWFTGNGMLYLYDADLAQYDNNFWPTVDSNYQQGTTVLDGATQAGGYASASSFVGGSPSYDGTLGVAVMRLQPTSDSLDANKAWFFLDDAIVCLGNSITTSSTSSTADLRTVVANRQLTAAGTNTAASPLGTSNASPTKAPGWYTNSAPISWFWLDGNASGSSVGMYFPTALKLDSVRETNTGAWTDIDTYTTYANETQSVSDNYYVATINHTTSGTTGYAYVMLPTASQSATSAYASAPEVQVIENDATAQAITDAKLGATSAIFWNAATTTVGSGTSAITSDSPSATFVTNRNGNLEIAVSDPTQTNTGTVHITLGQSALSTIDASPGITVSSLSPITLAINVNGLAGLPALARFNLSSAGLTVVDNASNSNGSTVSSTGIWTASTGTAGYYGSNYVQDGNTNKGGDTFTFTPNVGNSGSYDVQIWYPAASNRATNVPVTVNFAGGSQTFTVDETSNGGSWQTLGSFAFNAGTAGSVVISNAGTNGYVVADAVRLVAR